MQHFQPPGFKQQVVTTHLGVMAYYTQDDEFWNAPNTIPQDQPLLVFLHSLGGGSSAYEWSKVYPTFGADYRVIAPDLIGWGQSAHPPKDYVLDDYSQIVDELLEHCGQPVTLVATSLTGGLAIRVAIAHPDKVRSLFLVCPSGYADFGVDYQRGLAAQLAGTPLLDRLIYTVGAANELAVRNFLQQFLFADASRITDEMVAAYLASALQPNAEYSALSSLKGALFFDLSRYVGQLTVPTAFLWGEKSRFNTPALGRRLAGLNPDAITAFYEVPNTGVLPHLELPAVVAGLLRRWLKEKGI
ncbi:MAG: alpha/beta hydrolase [Leptolyngbyaceae bacterium]|nr:alpha/beta hydrolase [Leptolyngbyaceae bacterium]